MTDFICTTLVNAVQFIKRQLAWNEDRTGPVILAVLIIVALTAALIGAVVFS